MTSTRWTMGRRYGLGLLALALVAFHAPVAEAGRSGGSRGGSSFGGSRSSSGGSFGGSSRSSGGSFGGSSRSSGSSSFSGSKPSSGGSFGSSSSSKPSTGGSFGAPRTAPSTGRSTSGGSFGSSSSSKPSSGGSFGSPSTTSSRTGSFGSAPSFARSSSSVPRYYSSRTPISSSPLPYAVAGYAAGSLMAHRYGGWSDYSYGWAHPRWYYYTPFSPAFYYGRPVYVDGALYPGSFSLGRLIFGAIALFFVVAIIAGLVKGRGPKYTTYSG